MIKLTSINIQKTYNTGNYESLRVGGDFEIDDKETVEHATEVARRTIEQMHDAFLGKAAPKLCTPENHGRTEIQFGTTACQRIINRIAAVGTTNPKTGQPFEPVTREMIDKNYILDAEASNAVNLAIALNSK